LRRWLVVSHVLAVLRWAGLLYGVQGAAMIYLKDKAGVRVEDDGSRIAVHRFCDADQSCVSYLSTDEADAVLAGLLRWKLETDWVARPIVLGVVEHLIADLEDR
jgi:hypothetical protein